VAEDGLNLRN